MASVSVGTLAATVEVEPTLKLADFDGLPAASGNAYKIDGVVPVAGHNGQFTVHTDLGELSADGTGQLKRRVAEVGPALALAELSNSSVFVDALAKSAASTAQAVGRAVTSPIDTVKAAPAGVGRFFKSVGSSLSNVASDHDKGGAAKDALGINKAKRQLAQKVGVDPYTTNPIVAERLDSLASAAFAGGVSLDVALAVTTAGVGTALSMTKTVSNLAWQLPPEDIRARNDAALAAFDIDQQTRDSLLNNRWFTPTLDLAYVEELNGLGVRRGSSALTKLAAAAESETEAMFFIDQLRMARAFAQGGDAVVAIEASGRIGMFRTASGALFVPAPLDYLAWTEGVKAFTERPDFGDGARVVWLSGKASPVAAAGLAAAGWKLRENAFAQ